jgi:hypothetical protein
MRSRITGRFGPETPVEIVAMIKAIFNLDRRERQHAGFKYGSTHLADRIAEQFGLDIYTVLMIKHRRRRKNVHPSRLLRWGDQFLTERLETICQSRVRSGAIAAPWKPIPAWPPKGAASYKKCIQRVGKPVKTPSGDDRCKTGSVRGSKHGPDRPPTNAGAGRSKTSSGTREP